MNGKVKLMYFGMISEVAGKMSEELEVNRVSVEELLKRLVNMYPSLAGVQCRVAVNRKLQQSGEISSGDEVAVMPPFSGG